MRRLDFKICLLFLITCSYSLNAQNPEYKSGLSNLLNASIPEEIGVRTTAQINSDSEDPLEYGYVDDNDILWSTIVYEIIDLDERVNFPLLYPTQFGLVGNERRPMLWWLRQEIEKGSIPVYDQGDAGGYFLDKVEPEDVTNIFRKKNIYDVGNEKRDNGAEEIRFKIEEQEEKFSFNPYNEGLSSEEIEVLQNTPNFIKLFPYKIKDDQLAESFLDGIITYDQFSQYENEEILDDDLLVQYELTFREMVEELLFVFEMDYDWIEVDYSDLRQWLIKGVWYFDKKYSELIYRPIGIAPVILPQSADEDDFSSGSDEDEMDELPTAEELLGDGEDSDGDGISDDIETDEYDLDPDDPDTDGDGLQDGYEVLRGLYADDPDYDSDGISDGDEIANGTNPFVDENNSGDDGDDSDDADDVSTGSNLTVLFWVYYPQARGILKKGHAFNSRNMTQSISFDEIINSRRFNGVIYKEENVYENREVKDYIPNNSFMRLLESERIKEKIRNFEHDMWSW